MKNILSWITFNENSDYQILPIEISDKIEVLDICAEALKHVDNPERIKQYLGRATEWDISKKCVFNGKIIGAYLLNHFPVYRMLEDCERLFSEKKIPYFSSENYQKYRNLRGIHGLALVVDPAYQKTGAGKKLRDVPLTMGYDYIWGMHLETLKNIEQWTNFGRRVLAKFTDDENETVYITVMDLDKKSS